MWDRRFVVSGSSSPFARARYTVANLLFPPLCAGCDQRGTWLCERCFASVPAMDAIPGRCKRCDLPIVSGRCGCASLHPKVSRAVSAHPYAGWVSRSVVGIKYEGEKDRARFLGAVLAVSRASDLLARGDVVVPVPMFERKRRERGYNQVELMAEEACALLGAPGPRPVLIQHEERRSQVGLSARERRDNVRGSFSLNPEVVIHPGARIVLVDDVRTTGATLSACVEVVRATRPRRIDVVTLAAELPGEVMRDLGLEN